jgi:hypothetical protein
VVKNESDVDNQSVKQNEVIQFSKEVATAGLAGNGFTYRHDWGSKHGWWTLNLNWGAITCNSRVFVSASEFSGG